MNRPGRKQPKARAARCDRATTRELLQAGCAGAALNPWQRAHELDGFGALGVEEVAEGAQVSKRINTRVVAVAPAEAEGVVADLLEVAQVEVAALLELDHARVALAARAGAIAAQDFMGQSRLVPIGPADFELFGAMGGFDPGGLGAGLVGHRSGGSSRMGRQKLVRGGVCRGNCRHRGHKQ
jgi:hypothetical protein